MTRKTMKPRRLLLITGLFFITQTDCFSQSTAGGAIHTSDLQDTSANKNTIALLGVYHFNNPGLDEFNIKSDNVLSEKRQKEIGELSERLARYSPTHIALEYDAANQDADEKYQHYLKGEYVLTAAESEQVGFRLAKLLGHPHIYPVDKSSITLDFEPGVLGKDYGTLLQQLGKEGGSIVSTINDWLNKYTISEVLAKMNKPETDLLNINLYYKYLLPIGRADNNPGLDAVTRWYKRNLFILHNIMKLAEGKNNNRILVIFGQGHTAMLNQFLQYSTVFQREDIGRYLPKVK